MDAGTDKHPAEAEADALFLNLFVTNEKALRTYARALVPTWDAVDDLIQEASLVMWRKLHQLDSADNFLPWAKVIVRFEALRCRRKFACDRLVFSEDLLAMLASEAEEMGDDNLSIEKALLKRCLGRLSADHRELLLVPYAGHGGVTELAARTNRSPNSLYKLLGRLRAKLQHCIEAETSRSARFGTPRIKT